MPLAGYSHFYNLRRKGIYSDCWCVNALGGLFSFLLGLLVLELIFEFGVNALGGLFSFLHSFRKKD